MVKNPSGNAEGTGDGGLIPGSGSPLETWDEERLPRGSSVCRICRMSRIWSDEKGGKVFWAGETPGQRPGTKREWRFGAGAALNDGSSMEC